jgi:hypothetical protein
VNAISGTQLSFTTTHSTGGVRFTFFLIGRDIDQYNWIGWNHGTGMPGIPRLRRGQFRGDFCHGQLMFE